MSIAHAQDEGDAVELQEVEIEADTVTQSNADTSEAINFIDTTLDKKLTASLGEVLARTQGVTVRRDGGLGSASDVSLNGLTGEQVRFYLDGLPLHLAGYTFGIGDIPVNLVEGIEVYKGVVPIRFGGDALAGAINLVTESDVYEDGLTGAVSHQAGSFGTQRSTAGLRYFHDPSGFVASLSVFRDRADNDYEIDAKITDEQGQRKDIVAKRFHDSYAAEGVNLQFGVVDKSWAKKLFLRLFASEFDKDIQHGASIDRPYGDVTQGGKTSGQMLSYSQDFGDTVRFDIVAGQSESDAFLHDVGIYNYNWLGETVSTHGPGELSQPRNQPRDQTLTTDSHFSRLHIAWEPRQGRIFNLAVAPTNEKKTGSDPFVTSPKDLLYSRKELDTLVSGVEYKDNFFDHTLENTLFFKHYKQKVYAQEQFPGDSDRLFRNKNREGDYNGFGNAVRYFLNESGYLKASFERAYRLPQVDEIFGDGALVVDNVELEPEESDNFNLTAGFENYVTDTGIWQADITYFLRKTDELILLLDINAEQRQYFNIASADSEGIELAAEWKSAEPVFGGASLRLAANATWQDLVNTSTIGPFSRYKGDRLPNRPDLYANAGAHLDWDGVFHGSDSLGILWHLHWVDDFFRGWESLGIRSSKPVIPSQFTQNLALAYQRDLGRTTLNLTAELQNLTDEKVFDNFGIQKPGRAFYVKA